jgi:hypothetical protein
MQGAAIIALLYLWLQRSGLCTGVNIRTQNIQSRRVWRGKFLGRRGAMRGGTDERVGRGRYAPRHVQMPRLDSTLSSLTSTSLISKSPSLIAD